MRHRQLKQKFSETRVKGPAGRGQQHVGVYAVYILCICMMCKAYLGGPVNLSPF